MAKIIGLTGPIASGKNLVAGFFRRRGAYVIEVDQLAHKLYSPQTEVWQTLVKRFGSQILRRGGVVDRRKLGAIVFNSAAARDDLNRIIHPLLFEKVREEVLLVKSRGVQLIIINAALLEKIGLNRLVDAVWVVKAKVSVRLRRLIKKGWSKAEAQMRIAAQRGFKNPPGAVVINNNSTRAALLGKLRRFEGDWLGK